MKPSKDRFMEKVDTSGDCWIWTGATTKNRNLHPRPYGIFYLNGRKVTAHRASVILFKGAEVQDGIDVCHTCDNTLCVNPEHLFLGTRSENMKDCANKGRLTLQTNPAKSPTRKLTASDVRSIRSECNGLRSGEIAKRFNVDKATVKRIRNGSIWKQEAKNG